MTEKKRTDFNYRQLENNLIYISDSIIQAYKSNKLELIVDHQYNENFPSSRYYEIEANLEKSFIELGVYFSWPNNIYIIRIWDKSMTPTDKDKKIWKSKAPCPGHLAWQHENEDLSEEGFSDFDSGLHKLIYEYVQKIQDFYLSAGGISPEIKNLL
ncbi:hypothetical protein A0J48_003685 [Sphaerospermopsis aphanizomenoides BCCUSP55]|uniref:hypothetical protein n=1 Tax=Sphaerospermopsis aphanizomenoides TaxID=459663 RepID=UPI001908E1E6|nr:hypothetical protein [Sphaerospermopsis aphanizomenoides]MBK1986650.1 hypothetical protein [Sphaerospermopsis aphanizomenoides BCCUSP55]